MKHLARHEVTHALLLRDAKRCLQAQPLRKDNYGICAALYVAHVNLKEIASPTAQDKILMYRTHIEDRIVELLEGHPWLNGWLLGNGFASKAELESDAGRRKIRQTRLNWIDDLIRYFEEKE